MLEIHDLDEVYSRVASKIVKQDGCWLVLNNPTSPYAQVKVQGTSRKAHVISYMYHVGDVPFGMELDHQCKNKRCVNPDHLEVVTSETNSRRSKGWYEKDGHWYCKREHLVEGHNLRKAPNGHWSCRLCLYHSIKQYKAGKSKTKSSSLFKY